MVSVLWIWFQSMKETTVRISLCRFSSCVFICILSADLNVISSWRKRRWEVVYVFELQSLFEDILYRRNVGQSSLSTHDCRNSVSASIFLSLNSNFSYRRVSLRMWLPYRSRVTSARDRLRGNRHRMMNKKTMVNIGSMAEGREAQSSSDDVSHTTIKSVDSTYAFHSETLYGWAEEENVPVAAANLRRVTHNKVDQLIFS